MQQRPVYAQSPPLHHPVPQHVSTVPQLRSPPPPTSSQPQQQGAYGNPYQQGAAAGGPGNVFGAYGNFMNDPTAQIGVQLGQNAFKAGQEYLENNVGAFTLLPMYGGEWNILGGSRQALDSAT